MRRKNLKTRLSQICYFAFLASTFGAVIAPPFLTKAFFFVAMLSWVLMESL